MKSVRSKCQGFTLIELMIVIAIVGLMATMAVPSYQGRVIRAQIKEGLGLAKFPQDEVQAYYFTHKKLPQDNQAAGLPPADKIVGNFVSHMQVVDGTVHMTFGNNANRNLAGRTLSIRPAVVAGYSKVPLAWVCGSANVPSQMSTTGENRTDLPSELLPLDCRTGPALAS